MFDTNLVVVGNVLAAPEWRRFEDSGAVVANFRVASTSRRFDRESNSWVDGNSLRVRVTAWRRLADSVISSITVGDPVIVYGRLYTRDWKDESGNHRISYEMEAYSIGHDLARGTGQFVRNRAQSGTTVEDLLPGGDAAAELPAGFGDGRPEGDGLPGGVSLPDGASLPGPEFPEVAGGIPPEPPTDEELAIEVERLTTEQPAPARRGRRVRKEPVAA